MKRALISHLSFVLLIIGSPALGDDLFMARSNLYFPEAMNALQQSILDHGYTVSRVQRVDIGLTGSGYKTDKYRIVFFGKTDEVKYLIEKYPHLAPFLPLKCTIFAEGEQTLITIANPAAMKELATSNELTLIFARWESDLRSLTEDFRNAE